MHEIHNKQYVRVLPAENTSTSMESVHAENRARRASLSHPERRDSCELLSRSSMGSNQAAVMLSMATVDEGSGALDQPTANPEM